MDKHRFTVALLLYLALIFGLSSLTHIPHIEHGKDKLVHTAEYIPVGFLLIGAILESKKRYSFSLLPLSLFLGAAVGALDELHQSFVPGRHSRIEDVAADVVGVAIGLVLYLVVKARKK